MNYYEQIKERYPNLESSQENMRQWQATGFDALVRGELEDAETCFEKLAVAFSWLHVGFEGLAYVCYDRERLKKSEWFMMKAMSLAEGLKDKGKLEPKMLEVMQYNLKAIRAETSLFRWWESVDWDVSKP